MHEIFKLELEPIQILDLIGVRSG